MFHRNKVADLILTRYYNTKVLANLGNTFLQGNN